LTHIPIRMFVTLLLSVQGIAYAASAPNTTRQSEIIYLLRQDCGACHGMRLEGGLGPALKPDRLERWSPGQLAKTILRGRPGTPMPPWSPFLTDNEALWLAQQLKQGIRQ